MLSNLAHIIGGESKVLLLVLFSLLAGEIGIRCTEDKLSKDIVHLKSFDEIAATFADPSSEFRILFLGNSMTREGVDQQVFEKEFTERTGLPVVTAKINPDNTALADWYYAYLDFFIEQNLRPDLVVMGFSEVHLSDRPSIHSDRLARFYCDADDWCELCRHDLIAWEDRFAYEVARFSALYSDRDRIERRVLDLLIPNYRDSSQQINVSQKQQSGHRQSPATYTRLQKLNDAMRAQGTTLVLAAMPLAKPYELDSELQRIVAREGIPLIDCRNVPGLSAEMLPDGTHLSHLGSQLYSEYLASHLASTNLPSRPAPASAVTRSIGYRN